MSAHIAAAEALEAAAKALRDLATEPPAEPSAPATPAKVGDIVNEEEAEAWLNSLPVGTEIADRVRDIWVKREGGWVLGTASRRHSPISAVVSWSPLTITSLPEEDEPYTPKVGDRVRLLSPSWGGEPAGMTGTVAMIRRDTEWPYEVRSDSSGYLIFTKDLEPEHILSADCPCGPEVEKVEPYPAGTRVRVVAAAPYGDAENIDGKTGVIVSTAAGDGPGYYVRIDDDQGGYWAGKIAAPAVGAVELIEAEPEAAAQTTPDPVTEALAATDEPCEVFDGDTLYAERGAKNSSAVAQFRINDGLTVYAEETGVRDLIAYLQNCLTAKGFS